MGGMARGGVGDGWGWRCARAAARLAGVLPVPVAGRRAAGGARVGGRVGRLPGGRCARARVRRAIAPVRVPAARLGDLIVGARAVAAAWRGAVAMGGRRAMGGAIDDRRVGARARRADVVLGGWCQAVRWAVPGGRWAGADGGGGCGWAAGGRWRVRRVPIGDGCLVAVAMVRDWMGAMGDGGRRDGAAAGGGDGPGARCGWAVVVGV